MIQMRFINLKSTIARISGLINFIESKPQYFKYLISESEIEALKDAVSLLEADLKKIKQIN
jgi:hypothetical protein